jgi:methionine-rich copper-binding protein CopC
MVTTARIARYTLGVMTLVLLMALGSRRAGVSAHALFLWGIPDNGAVVSTAPSQLEAHFAEDIVRQSGTYGLKVTDSTGNEVDNQDTVIDDTDRRHMTVTLQSGLGPDTYTVHWWTVSDEDGDAASGDYSFTISSS